MTTVERLFVQIFERKNRIIEQVKQQTDLYSQHLASKLLLDGVTPPPWLWNPNFNSETSDPKELKKEDLISELLFPHPRQGVPYSGTHCSLYSQPVVVGDNGQLSEGLAMDAHACDKDFNAADRPTIEPNRHDNNVGCVLNCVHELDTSATSPQGQIESMISNIYTVPDQSLARIQRSKSRQKALELRKSAKSTAKIHLTNDNGTSVCSSRNKLSRTAFRWPEQDIEFDKSEGRWAPGDHVSKEKSDHVYCGRITRSRSSCSPSCHENKISKLENSSNIAKEDRARLRNVAISCVEGMLKPISSSVQQRISRSKSGASKNYPLSDSLNRSEHLHPQNFSGDDVIPTFPDSNSIVNQQERTDCVEESLPISGRLVEVLAANTESDMCAAGLRLENSVSRIPSGCRIFVKPKVLDFDDVENCSLNENFCSMLEMERLEKSSGKQDGTSAKSITSQDKITFDNPSRKSLENQSLEQEVLKKTVTPEACRGSFETFAEEQVLVDKELSESKMNKNPMNVGDNKKADKEIQHCPVSCVVDGELQQISDGLGAENHDKCELGFDGRNRSEATTPLFKQQELEASVLSSLTKHSFGDQGCPFRKVGVADLNDYAPAVRQCYVEDDQDFTCPGNELDKGNTSDLPYNERTMQEKELHVREEGLVLGSVYSPLNKSMHLITSQNIELQLIEQCLTTRRRLRSSAENSWPLFKRRKIEAQVNCFSASPSFRVKEIQNISGLTANRYLKNDADKLWSDTQFQFILASPQGDLAESHIDKNSNVESHRKVMTQEIMHSPELQHEQDELSYEEGNPNMKSSSTFNQGRLGLSAVSSFTKEVGGDSTACSIEYAGHISRPGSTEEDTMSTALDVGMCRNADTHQKLLPSENAIEIEDKDGCSDTGKMLQETGSHLDEDGLFSSCSVASPKDEHLGSIAANQIMPEFEGFILDTDEKRQQHVTGNDCSFEKLDLPGTTIERAIALEQLCKSASMHTPLSEFSATFKLHKTPALYHSVPNGFLKDMDTRNTLNLKDDVGKNTAFPGLSYSDCVPFADACHVGSVKTLPTSPGGNLWNRISSYSSFSVRQTSSNPEITCFRIDEDPSISEEIENRDEAADMVQEEYSKPTNFGARREPFAEITETCANIPVSAPSAERYPSKISLDSIRNEVSWAGTRNKVKDELENCSDNRCTSEAEKCTLPVGTNCINKVKESLHHRFSKPKLSGKTSLRKGGQRLSKRDSKRNNIVSNITSFVPLVQQKQAAATAVGTGKRDIKVKALEAAEAAKRLEEKRQNERKMKKEALKLERARKQQENLREMELKKKKKEEEQKKKDADMAARKRLREEEERKEKERKRKRMEEARQQQREQEEKLRIGKLEKISSGATDKKVSSGTKSSDISREQQRMADKRVDDNTVKKTENVRQVAADNAEAPTHHIDTVEPTCISTRTDENDALVANTIHQESYEISPYQCSDDEDDDEDEMPTRKFIPSWASKNSVALVLFSQQNVDPDSIFPPESFCSIDEVLRPRKSHIK